MSATSFSDNETGVLNLVVRNEAIDVIQLVDFGTNYRLVLRSGVEITLSGLTSEQAKEIAANAMGVPNESPA